MDSFINQIKTSPIFRDNKFERPITCKEKYSLYNPTRGHLLCELASGNLDDLLKCVASAKEAYQNSLASPHWSGYHRSLFLAKLASLIELEKDFFIEAEIAINGKPAIQAYGDVMESIRTINYYAGFADKVYGKFQSDHYSPDNTWTTGTTRLVPIGVVGVILGYNYPLLLACWKLGPALAFGNAVILKPANQNPIPALKLAELCAKAGLPAGFLSVLHGDSILGSSLCTLDDVSKVSFTGSKDIGRILLHHSSESCIKRITLELGGSSPMIIHHDVDIDRTVESLYWAAFANAGQVCCAADRVFIHERIYKEFLEKFKLRLNKAVIGDPKDQTTEIGPMISKDACNKIHSYLDSMRAKNFSLFSPNINVNDQCANGFFVKPTIIYDMDTIEDEEVFGPVLKIFKPYAKIKDAIQRANDTKYGLAAAIFSNDASVLEICSRFLEAGTIWCNTYNFIIPSFPFGGIKGSSGIGSDLGVEAMNEYTAKKTVFSSYHFDLL